MHPINKDNNLKTKISSPTITSTTVTCKHQGKQEVNLQAGHWPHLSNYINVVFHRKSAPFDRYKTTLSIKAAAHCW